MDTLWLFTVCLVTILVCTVCTTQARFGNFAEVLSRKEHDIENSVQHIVRQAVPAVEQLPDQSKQLSDQAKQLSDQAKQLSVQAKELTNQAKQLLQQHLSGNGCQCVEYNCGCCAHLTIPEIRLDHMVCVNVSYLPHDYGVRATMSIDKFLIFNVTISAKNPPPICAAVPFLKDAASICIDFYNLDVTDKVFSGCIRLEAKLAYVIVSKIELGCFRIPLKNLEHMRMCEGMIAQFKTAQLG